MIVTDKVWKTIKTGDIKKGFYMDGYLVSNLQLIPAHLAKDWDVVGIVSGSAKVRIAKSTQAMACAYFVAWALAGGRMNIDRDDKINYGTIDKLPKKQVKFTLEDNVVFSAKDLIEKATAAEKNSVFVLDEEEGLDAKSTMMNLNRTMADFFQKCGFKNHFIIVVLPDFFSLNKDIACARTNFLINTYVGDNYQRGFFSFYNERRKEKLYEFGRRLLGAHSRYMATEPNFRGRFRDWLPFDKGKYELAKKKALDERNVSKRDIKTAKQRDIVIHMLQEATNFNSKEVADKILEGYGVRIGREVIRRATTNALKLQTEKAYSMQEEDEEEE